MFRKMEGGRRRAGFRIHLGYAPGLGATTHMLNEARRRQSRGTDVVVGAVRFGQAVEVVGETPKRYRIRAVDPRGTSVSTTLGGGRRHVERAGSAPSWRLVTIR